MRLAVVAGVTLALTACGKDGVTKADVIAQGNAICQDAQAKVRTLKPPDGTSLRALAPYLAKASRIVDDQAAKLRRLPRAGDDAAALARFKAASSRDAKRYRGLSDAANAHDRGAYERAATALRTSTSSRLADRYGLTGCSGASPTDGAK